MRRDSMIRSKFSERNYRSLDSSSESESLDELDNVDSDSVEDNKDLDL